MSTALPQKKVYVDSRHIIRQVIIQLLFVKSRSNLEFSFDPEFFWLYLDDESLSNKVKNRVIKSMDQIKQIVSEIYNTSPQIDSIIQGYAPTWPLDQIDPVELQILRLAYYEAFIKKTIEPKIAIDEAIELAKDFSAGGSSSFVSGVLGNIYEKTKNTKITKNEV